MDYIKTEKGSPFTKFMGDFWRLQEKYLNGDPNLSYTTNDFWNSVVADTNEICKKYINTPFHEYSMNLLLTFINELERKQTLEKGASVA